MNTTTPTVGMSREMTDVREDVQRRCNTIEEAYEFMLAYAAQGLPGDTGSPSGGQLRELLTRAAAALTDIGDVYGALVEREAFEPAAMLHTIRNCDVEQI